MKNYKLALKSIQKVKELVTGMSFDDAYYKLAGYNCDDDLFDFDYENISGTVWNENGMARISTGTFYDIIDDDWENAEEPIELGVRESEIEKRAGNSITIGRNEILGMTYDEMNCYECIDDGD